MGKISPYKVSGPEQNGFTETVKFHVLACGNVSNNNNKFYCIELQKNPTTNKFRLFTHYGRIGITNVYEVRDNINGTLVDNNNLSILEAEFENIIKKKKKVTAGKSTYETVDTVAPSVGSYNIRNVSSASASTASKGKGQLAILDLFGDAETKEMIVKVWEENIHSITNLTTMKVSSSGISSPLGPLTIGHIDAAARVLDQIKGAYSLSLPEPKLINDLNAKYYSMIPHPFGHKITQDALISNDKKFLEEFDLIEQLRSAVQIGGTEPEKEIKDIGVNISILDKSDPVWKAIERQYTTSKAQCHAHMKQYIVKRIFNVDNKRSTKGYENLDRRFKTKEFDLFHGSRSCNIMSILLNGLIVPPRTSPTFSGRMFGDGIYAASASTKALNYATGYWSRGISDKHSEVYMFVVKFAMGTIHYPRGTMYNGPPAGYDSIWAKAKDVNLANDEFIVYKTDQATIKYLIQLEHK